jgi:hypothetical protein
MKAWRRVVNWLDGAFYGSNPAPKPTPAWIALRPPRDGDLRTGYIERSELETGKGV